jgi:hypothetical protein
MKYVRDCLLYRSDSADDEKINNLEFQPLHSIDREPATVQNYQYKA